MLLRRLYYKIKFLVPRPWMLAVRRAMISRARARHAGHWPVDPRSADPPRGWAGWPGGKPFALVLTHDVESTRGLARCLELAAIEERLGFRSSFNFVCGDYAVPKELRDELTARGFEIGVHGWHHKDSPFRSDAVFTEHAGGINRFLQEWGSVGFRSPSMYHDLDMIHRLDIEYDASTFDTDPFEPQPDGMGTIFPFWVPGPDGGRGYVELPYTLPQDFLLFVLMREASSQIWEEKLDWIAGRGGMALVNVHPDYMAFGERPRPDEYPVRIYEDFLSMIRTKHGGRYWNALPREMARFWKTHHAAHSGVPRKPLHVCMPVYNFYESDNRVMRYAEALAGRGDRVEILALGNESLRPREEIRGVQVSRIQDRNYKEKHKISYFLKLALFLVKSSMALARRHLKDPYDFIHVHSVPDFEVFAALIPKLKGAKVVLDIHDIVPEFYSSKFGKRRDGLVFKALARIERWSCAFADRVIISNHLWFETLVSRSVPGEKCRVIMNYPDETIFHVRPRKRADGRTILIYHGTVSWHQGLDLAVKALARIKDRAPGAELHIYGGGPEEQGIRQLAQELGLDDSVLVMDGMPIAEMAAVVAEADLGIVPKRNDSFAGQAFSTKILELMSLGIPAIVARTTIDRFYFNDAVVKFFEPEDVDDLARAMLSMIMDRDKREGLARNALAFVADYRWSKKKAEYFDLVDGLVSPSRSRGKRGLGPPAPGSERRNQNP